MLTTIKGNLRIGISNFDKSNLFSFVEISSPFVQDINKLDVKSDVINTKIDIFLIDSFF